MSSVGTQAAGKSKRQASPLCLNSVPPLWSRPDYMDLYTFPRVLISGTSWMTCAGSNNLSEVYRGFSVKPRSNPPGRLLVHDFQVLWDHLTFLQLLLLNPSTPQSQSTGKHKILHPPPTRYLGNKGSRTSLRSPCCAARISAARTFTASLPGMRWF